MGAVLQRILRPVGHVKGAPPFDTGSCSHGGVHAWHNRAVNCYVTLKEPAKRKRVLPSHDHTERLRYVRIRCFTLRDNVSSGAVLTGGLSKEDGDPVLPQERYTTRLRAHQFGQTVDQQAPLKNGKVTSASEAGHETRTNRVLRSDDSEGTPVWQLFPGLVHDTPEV